MKHLEIFHLLRQIWGKTHKEKADYLICEIARSHRVDLTDEVMESTLPAIKCLVSRMTKMWLDSNRKLDYFLKRNSLWLETEEDFFASIAGTSNGRPEKSFEELGTRSKCRRTAELRSAAGGTLELVHAAASSLHADGQRDSSTLMLEVFAASPTRPKKVQRALEEDNLGAKMIRPYSPEQALNLIVQAKLTKCQYLTLRRSTQGQNAGGLYPNYHKIREAKTECYPPEADLTVTEYEAKIELQALMDLTVTRLIRVVEPVLESLSPDQLETLVLVSKWGSDGSSGFSMHKQVSENPDLNDCTVYATSVVPLQLYTGSDKKVIVWQNPSTSSPRYCRPMKLQFAKETTDLIVTESKAVQDDISKLVCSTAQLGSGQRLKICHEMHMTMVDGKLCNALTSTKSTQSCYICGAKPSQMNKPDVIEKLPVNEDALKYGLSVLHAWIRCFEYLLHVAYKLGIGKLICKTKEDRGTVEKTKREIQQRFKKELGLIVDMPKQGFGTSNDGSTARRFSRNSEVTSSITQVGKELIHSFCVLLEALSSPYEINVKEYQIFSKRIFMRCIELYPWYTMPPTVHKILVHGASVIQAAPLPIGMFSEDAQESRHKDLKYFRVFNTRKMSREECNRDLLHMCLITSDPLITSLRKLPPKKTGSFSPAVLRLLNEPDIATPLQALDDCTCTSSDED